LLARHLQPEEHLVALRRNAEQILALLRQSPAVDQKRVSQLEARLLGFNGVEMPHHISISAFAWLNG
jgi:hypothetical protein